MQGCEDTVVYNVDYSLQEPHLILWGISWSLLLQSPLQSVAMVLCVWLSSVVYILASVCRYTPTWISNSLRVIASEWFPNKLLSWNKANCSFDKENSIEFLLDSVHYLYMKSNPNPSFYPTLPYESLFSHVSIDKKRKEKKMKRKIIIRNKRKEKKKKYKYWLSRFCQVLTSVHRQSVLGSDNWIFGLM